MENFCKGLIFGVTVGAIMGAVIVAKNKNLSSMVKEKAELVEKKINDVTEKVKEKIEESSENKESSSMSDTNSQSCNSECICQN